MSRQHSLRTRISLILTLIVLLISSLGVTLISVINLRLFDHQAQVELERGERVFSNVLKQHDHQLIQAAQLLAADFGFRSALASHDAPTIVSALDNQRQRIQAEIAFLSDLDGQVVADSQQRLPIGSAYPFPQLFEQAMQNGQTSSIEILHGQAYSVVVVPVRAPLIVGWVTMGMPVDDRMAQDFERLSGLQVSFVAEHGKSLQVLSSTLPANEREDLARQQDLDAQRLSLAHTTYQSRRVTLNPHEQNPVSVLLQRPLDEILAPFYALLKVMLGLIGLSLLLVGFGSVRIARVVTKPLQQLVDAAMHIRDGDYQYGIKRPSTLELAQLAESLNHMQSAIAEREQRILDLVYRDELTGLYNRKGFLKVLEQHLRTQQPHTVVLLNIDRFQQINDTLGHPFGDCVLKAFATQLKQLIPEHVGHLARLSGDEFAVLLSHQQAWQPLLQLLMLRFESALLVEDRALDVRATMGYAHFPEHASSAVELLCCADEALYVAKSRRIPMQMYNPHRQQFREEHLSLLGELKRAVEHHELRLYYQPKVSLLDQSVHEAEALIRWQHPQRGFIPPNEFIPFAEQTGYIRDLTRWVIAQGCRDAALMAQQGKMIRVSVNIATRDLQDPHLPEYVLQCLTRSQLAPSLLCLEITESGVMEESQQVMDNLQCLKQMGVALAIDDYGTGYSSLAYVRQLPVSELKIDRSFIKNVASNKTDAMIVHSTIELAHSLNFMVVAEGVETQEVSDRLRELGCDLAQGYLYAKPLSLSDFQAWLADYTP